MKREVVKQLKSFLRGEWVILGIGNRLRGDDGFGSVAAEIFLKFTGSVRIFDGCVASENFLGKIAKLKAKSIL
ncbi:MAG TPA: hydrogenase maturation peptidase HycI, partial [candidate division Zixibacteria bacterium]|nr:hydrogenase maturation peptidase HycI [candidate division Zixibacteria bacterium]